MARTRRFLAGVSFGYVSMVLMLVVGLWLTPFLLQRIGVHDYGLWLITTQVLGYLALMDLGVVALASRETAFATGRVLGGGHDDLTAVLARFYATVRWQIPLTAIACALAWWVIGARWPALTWPMGLILLAFVVAFPFRLYQATLQGLQELAFLGKVQLSAWIAGTLVTVTLVMVGVGLEALAAGWVMTQFFIVTACALRLQRRYPSTWNVETRHVAWPEARELFQRSGWVSLAQVSQVFLNGSDILILGAIMGPAATVPYACTSKLISVLANHPMVLMQAAGPAIAEMRTSAPRERLTAVVLALSRAMLLVSGAVACFVLAANETFVVWWVGASQFAGVRLTVMLVAVMLARHFATTMVYSLFSFGYERRLSLTALCDGFVTVAVTAMLASYTSMGLMSPAIGSLVGVMVITLPACASTLARELGITVARLLASTAGWATRFAAIAAISLAGHLIGLRGFSGVAILGMAVGVIYVAFMWPLVMQPPLGAYVRSGASSLRAHLLQWRQAAVGPRL